MANTSVIEHRNPLLEYIISIIYRHAHYRDKFYKFQNLALCINLGGLPVLFTHRTEIKERDI
jgi:hypothetical protein